MTQNTEDKVRISYSLLTLFRNCRKAAYYRYVRGLKPLTKSDALNFGSIIHEGLEEWHRNKCLNKVFARIDPLLPERDDLLVAHAMLEAYTSKYSVDDLEPVIIDGKSSIEIDFECPIIDMDTMDYIPDTVMVGKIDGIVKKDNEYFILEHKTAAKLDGNYIDKLWSDFQITLYCYFVNKFFKIPCHGVLYNILVKPDFKRKRGETNEEFKMRQIDAAAKNKSGKTNIKQKHDESDNEFALRLQEFYAESTAIHRETIYIGKKQMRHVISEVSELTKAFTSCMKRDRYYMNTDHCFRYGYPCSYFSLCRSGENEHILNNNFELSPRFSLDVIKDYTGDAL